MLVRHSLGYFLAALVQTVCGIGIIAILTRWFDEETFGHYAIAMAVIPLVGSLIYFWSRAGITRYYAQAEQQLRLGTFLGSIRSLFVTITLIAVPLGLILVPWIADDDEYLKHTLWACLATVIAQSAFQINLELHRAGLRPGRYTLWTMVQNALSFTLAVIGVVAFGFGVPGVVLATAFGCLVCVLCDRDCWRFWFGRALGRWRDLLPVLAYGLPLTATTAIDTYLGNGDRLVISSLLDVGAVAAYAAGQAIASRSLLVMASAIGSASMPIAVQRLEAGDLPDARARLAHAFELLMAICIPAAVGLAVLAQPIVALMIGPDLRGEAARLMPWVALGSLMGGFTAHYFNHAFQLASQPARELYAIIPAMAVSLIGNMLLVPYLGIEGALVALILTQMTYLGLSYLTARPMFAMPVDLWAVAKTALAAGMMALALLAPGWLGLSDPTAADTGLLGLVGAILGGIIVYGAMAWVLDLAGARGLVRDAALRFADWRHAR